MNERIRVRQFERLRWHQPEPVLRNLRYIETHVLLDDAMDDRVRRLRTNDSKDWREARDAAIFCYGLRCSAVNESVSVAKSECDDFDCVLRWVTGERIHYCPVQLKELPPDDLNPSVTLEDIYKGLEKYSGETDLAVATKVNRQGRLYYRPWERPDRPPIKELWLFGCLSADQSQWFIYGDVLGSPRYHEFAYPTSGGPVFA